MQARNALLLNSVKKDYNDSILYAQIFNKTMGYLC